MSILQRDRLAETGELPSVAERAQYWLACALVFGWTAVLCGGLLAQLTGGGPVGPLDVLQRLFMVLALLGAALIVRRALTGAIDSRDYLTGWGMTLVACVAGALVTWRHLAAVPAGEDGAVGWLVPVSHPQVWHGLFFGLSVLAIGAVMSFGYQTAGREFPVQGAVYRTGWLALVLAGAVIMAQVVAVPLLQGFHLTLPDGDP